ncbi:DUF1684 domain-containing protein [Arthrobacter sp. zg-Y20]|uniref:DUF1684 domain-containing protein n=1 Tax=unclassified Arthrobacter TaxID=235627 RepID=UPI001D1506D7|nr:MULTISPECIES: DUF1684 domain-containing protein [unclassified Arthrobacter]MCC3276705.1 DUF1684 domain-containing protein [Arthrobacter sp. zg-Y20]MDK1316864.1 DUF1684 domain-containing protein [Arthrobacter sp. zg.Y20]WIB06725.1 DUF1684 domain-containing protein [Arthrobacter sp. zg-Y20]
MSIDDTARTEWLRFRERRNATLAEEHGWLSLSGFYWLPEHPAKFDGLPGLWSGSDDGAVLAAAAADGLRVLASGEPAQGRLTASLADEESLNWVGFGAGSGGQVVVELARRAGRYALRPRDAASPVRTSFSGVPVYEYAPEWVLSGRFEPYRQPVEVPIRTAHPEVPGVQRSVGEVLLFLPGDAAEHRLQVSAAGPGTLNLTFHDKTNGRSTAGWRSLTFPAPAPGAEAGTGTGAGTAAGGTVVLDFNFAVNYPSAFTEFGTCPMPVDGNRIGAAVEAGEKRPDAV